MCVFLLVVFELEMLPDVAMVQFILTVRSVDTTIDVAYWILCMTP